MHYQLSEVFGSLSKIVLETEYQSCIMKEGGR